jgi:hypothetical protein
MKGTEIIIFIRFILLNINSNLEYLLLLFNRLIFIQNLGKQNHVMQILAVMEKHYLCLMLYLSKNFFIIVYLIHIFIFF